MQQFFKIITGGLLLCSATASFLKTVGPIHSVGKASKFNAKGKTFEMCRDVHKQRTPHNSSFLEQGVSRQWPVTTILAGMEVALHCSQNTRYARMNGNRDMDASGLWAEAGNFPVNWSWERFWVVDAGNVQVGFHSAIWNRYIRMNGWNSMDASGGANRNGLPTWWGWERWTVVTAGNNEWAFHQGNWRRFMRLRNNAPWMDASGWRLPGGHHPLLPINWTWERFSMVRLDPPEVQEGCVFQNQDSKIVIENEQFDEVDVNQCCDQSSMECTGCRKMTNGAPMTLQPITCTASRNQNGYGCSEAINNVLYYNGNRRRNHAWDGWAYNAQIPAWGAFVLPEVTSVVGIRIISGIGRCNHRIRDYAVQCLVGTEYVDVVGINPTKGPPGTKNGNRLTLNEDLLDNAGHRRRRYGGCGNAERTSRHTTEAAFEKMQQCSAVKLWVYSTDASNNNLVPSDLKVHAERDVACTACHTGYVRKKQSLPHVQ
jgi:hypothetical protein